MNEDIFFEKRQRLSKSVLWDLQKQAYCQFGPEAWSTKQVPFYLTSNPLLARQYAQIVLAFFKDCLISDQAIDLREPFYILDLGAGSGRFAYLFLNNLLEMVANLKLPFQVRYVMTDIVEANIQYWQEHPYFQRFLKDRSLDFAYYEHSSLSQTLDLLHSGAKLVSGSLKNPLTLIGNYFFDTIPQDIFCVKDHILHAGLISLSYTPSDKTAGLTAADPAIIPHILHHLDYVPVDIDALDVDPLAKEILASYAGAYENIPFLLFPTGPLQVISHFREFSKERVLFLTGDQGITAVKKQNQEIPFLAKHDTFSMLVNYHALEGYFKRSQGICLLTPSLSPAMVNMAAISYRGVAAFPEVQEVFRLTLAAFEPQDYFKLIDAAHQWQDPSLAFMLKLIKWGLWDPINFNLFFPKIREKLAAADASEKAELALAIEGCWKAFFPVHKAEGAFVMNLGVLCFDMKHYNEAIKYFKYALELGYDEPILHQNMKTAKYRSGSY